MKVWIVRKHYCWFASTMRIADKLVLNTIFHTQNKPIHLRLFFDWKWNEPQIQGISYKRLKPWRERRETISFPPFSSIVYESWIHLDTVYPISFDTDSSGALLCFQLKCTDQLIRYKVEVEIKDHHFSIYKQRLILAIYEILILKKKELMA